MSTPENPPAFPGCYAQPSYHPGMTLRDYFAAKATDNDIAPYINEGWCREGAKFAYADAMLAARNRAGEEGR